MSGVGLAGIDHSESKLALSGRTNLHTLDFATGAAALLLVIDGENFSDQGGGACIDRNIGNVTIGQCAHERDVVDVASGAIALKARVKTDCNVLGASAQQFGNRLFDVAFVVGNVVSNKTQLYRFRTRRDGIQTSGVVGISEFNRFDLAAS